MTASLKNIGLWAATLPRDILRWYQRGKDPAHPRVFYGFSRLPTAADKGYGGIIKAQDLQTLFPNTLQGANLLYLISSYPPLFASRLVKLAHRAGAVFVLNQNGVAYPGWFGQGWEKENNRLRQLHAQADHIVYQSQFCKDNAVHYLGQAKCPSNILHNPVDTRIFVPATTDPSPGKFVILLAGSHSAFYRPQVAIDTLTKLLARLPEARLVIAGRCAWRTDPQSAETELRAYAIQCGVAAAVKILGPYPQTAAVTLFQQAHVLLHTKYNDPCPRLVAEALSCGLPVVYSATGGVPELVGEGTGIGIPGPVDFNKDHPPSPALLADALYRIAQKQSLFGMAARQHAILHLDVRPWILKHKTIFESLLS
jgi:glycosyltransferase involved in cell wall biosynthesis